MMLNETNPNIKIDQSTFPECHCLIIISNNYRTENGISTRKKEEGETTETEIKIAEKLGYNYLQTGTVSVLIPENRDLKVNKAIVDKKVSF
jgi:hypothetical protein